MTAKIQSELGTVWAVTRDVCQRRVNSPQKWRLEISHFVALGARSEANSRAGTQRDRRDRSFVWSERICGSTWGAHDDLGFAPAGAPPHKR